MRYRGFPSAPLTMIYIQMPQRTRTDHKKQSVVQRLPKPNYADIGNTIITSPIQTVAHAERSKWRFRAYKADADALLQYMAYVIEFALPNQLALQPSQTLSIDDVKVRVEVEMAADKGYTHPPPSQPIRFLPTTQHEDDDMKGENDRGGYQ